MTTFARTPRELDALPIGEQLRGTALDVAELSAVKDDLDIEAVVLDIARRKTGSLDIRASVLSADLELSIDGAHQVTIVVHDAHRKLYKSGLLEEAIDLRIGGWDWRLARHSKSGRDITLTFEPRAVAWMRSKKKRLTASRARSTRAEFIHRLIRQVQIQKLGFVSPEEHKKQTIEGGKRDTAKRKNSRDTGLDSGIQIEGISRGGLLNIERALVVGEEGVYVRFKNNEVQKKTARRKVQIATCMCIMQESGGLTSATNGIHVGLFQQDPRYWPATRDVEKDSLAWYKAVILADVEFPHLSYIALIEKVQGSGAPQNYAPWEAKAKRIVDNFRGGGETAGALRPTRLQSYQFYVKKDENYYGAAMRLAEQVNWRLYTVRNVFHYESETHLLKAKSRMSLIEGEGGVIQIDYDRDGRRKVQEVTVNVFKDAWKAPIGTVVTVNDGGPADDRYLVAGISRSYFGSTLAVTLRRPTKPLLEPEPNTRSVPQGTDPTDAKFDLGVTGGAKDIVDQAVAIARGAGGQSIYVGSSYRPGSTTTSGNVSDHASNDSHRAARDIGVKGIDLLVGPPSPKLDKAVVAIGDALGRDYGNGKKTIVDTFNKHGWRIQIIWRTPDYGGHMGHIHFGCREA